MFKAPIQELAEKYGGSAMTPTLDPALVAKSFGKAYEIGPLPESPVPIRHVEDEEQEHSGLLLDKLKKIAPKEEPIPLVVLATRRLNSIKPRTREMAQMVAQTIADIQEPLARVDELVGILAMERVEAIETRLEELRDRGRKLRRHVLHDLQGAVHTQVQAVNVAEQEKGSAQLQLDSCITRLRQLRLDRFSTNDQLIAADEKVKSAVRKLNKAKEVRLEAEKQKAEADNALAIGQAERVAIEIAMDQCSAELAGLAYHDPNTGLSVDPLAHLQQ
jgi:chromosome segregation ATPase